MDNNLISVMEILKNTYPEKTLVDIAEVENEEHQTYKYLYESLKEQYNAQTEELASLNYKVQDLERELKEVSRELEEQRSANNELSNSTSTLMDFVKNFMGQEIVISDAHPVDKNGNAVTESKNKRPGWFTPLPQERELSKQHVAKKSADKTKDLLSDHLSFWEKMQEKQNKKFMSKIKAKMELQRKEKIGEIFSGNFTNEEKYLRYFLLTPGLPKDYINTLTGAADIGLDAEVVIGLMEQPEESFNMEMIELYVSETHKATEYNLKQELAEELMRGEWYISADFNGKQEKFQLAPMELINEIKRKLDEICHVLENLPENDEVGYIQEQLSMDEDREEVFSDYSSEPLEEDDSPIIEFDESLLDSY